MHKYNNRNISECFKYQYLKKCLITEARQIFLSQKFSS